MEHFEQRLRNDECHAIPRLAGLEPIFQRQSIRADLQLVWKPFRTRVGRLPMHEVRATHEQQIRIVPLGLQTPTVEQRHGVDALGNSSSIKLCLRRLVHNDVTAANLRFEPFDLFPQPPVCNQKVATHSRGLTSAPTPVQVWLFSVGVVDQRFVDENVACLARLNSTVINSPLRGQSQSVKRYGLECCNVTARTHPVRLGVRLLDKVCARGLDPQWIHRRHHARIYPRRFNDASRNHPLGRAGR